MTSWFGIVYYTFHKTFRGLLSVNYTKSSYTSSALHTKCASVHAFTYKILEHIICRHLLKHLEKNKILTHLNHDFRSGYSCETTINDFLQEHDKGQQVDIAILDSLKYLTQYHMISFYTN